MKKHNTNLTANNSGRSLSLWMEIPLPIFPVLETNLKTDVCIVGSGIVGLTCAYTLAKQGKNVVVVDQGVIAGGQTARTTAHLTWVLDDRYHHLVTLFGEEKTQLAAQSHAAAIDYIEKIIQEESIDCDWERVDGYLFVPPGESKDILYKEIEAIKKTGMEVNQVPQAPFSKTFDTGLALRFPNQGQFHAMKYIKGLLQSIIKYGGKIYSQTHVTQIKDGSPCHVNTANGHKISSESVIVATCSPINNRFMIHTKQAANRTYVIAATVPKGSVPKGLYWDTANPYHYIRTQKHLLDPDLDWLIVGGEDHRTGQDPAIKSKYHHLEKWAGNRFPMMKKIEYRWSGQIFEPVDSLAFIGKNPMNKNIYIATGDSGNGLTHGTIAGILIPDLILKRENPWKNLYKPSRKTLTSVPKYLHDGMNVSVQYMDWLTPGEKKKITSLPPDEGIILRKGLKKIAIYKDKNHQLHLNSAFCPHLGGCVHWNTGEKSWDCPCHGSRFDCHGKVITGPAINDLSPLENE